MLFGFYLRAKLSVVLIWVLFACYLGVIFNPYGILVFGTTYFGTKVRDARLRHMSRTNTVHYTLNCVHIWNYILYNVPYDKDYETVPYSTVR